MFKLTEKFSNARQFRIVKSICIMKIIKTQRSLRFHKGHKTKKIRPQRGHMFIEKATQEDYMTPSGSHISEARIFL